MSWFTRKALEALMPAHGDLKGIAETGLEDFLRRYHREAPLLLRAGLLASTALFHAAPIITVHVPLPAFWLPDDLLERHAEKMAGHPVYFIRMSTFTLKMIGGMCWSMDPDVRTTIGLKPLGIDPGTWVEST